MATKASLSSRSSLEFEEEAAILHFLDCDEDGSTYCDEEIDWESFDKMVEEEGGNTALHSSYCCVEEHEQDHCRSSSDCGFSEECCEPSEDGDEDTTMMVDNEYPDFVKPLERIENEDLVCLICQMVAINPMQSHCCGKIYCLDCVNKFKRLHPIQICPTCRKNGVLFFEDKRANRAILGLMVYCNHRERGCKWQGTLSDRGFHSEKCNYRVIVCPNECGKTLRYHQLNKHLNKYCPNRDYRCVHCGETGTWQYIAEVHSKECTTSKYLLCVNEGCSEKVKRSNQLAHQQTCPKKIIECPFANIGCGARFKREDLAKHNKTHKKIHNQYALTRASRPFVQNGYLHQVAPVVLTVDGFGSSSILRSLPFFTSIEGYKMSLLVRKEVNGSLGVYACMMPGEYDKVLRWPLECNITVELLNQLQDKSHLKFSTDIFVVKDSYYTKKESNGSSEYYKGIAIGSFGSNGSIGDDTTPFGGSSHVAVSVCQLQQSGFLVNDCLYFRVSCVDNRE